jgi:hypothetical protein
VVRGLHAVADVAVSELTQHRQQLLRAVEQADRGADHLHQPLPLVRHVALEQRRQRGVGREQVAVEDRCRLRRDRRHAGEALTHEVDLHRGHDCVPG